MTATVVTLALGLRHVVDERPLWHTALRDVTRRGIGPSVPVALATAFLGCAMLTAKDIAAG